MLSVAVRAVAVFMRFGRARRGRPRGMLEVIDKGSCCCRHRPSRWSGCAGAIPQPGDRIGLLGRRIGAEEPLYKPLPSILEGLARSRIRDSGGRSGGMLVGAELSQRLQFPLPRPVVS